MKSFARRTYSKLVFIVSLPRRMYSMLGAGYIAALIFLAIFIAAWGGWIANILKLCGLITGDFTAMFFARVVGVFAAPLGMVLGYF